MKVLDLHGMKHADVSNAVENFILMNELPVKIITGNSVIMKSIVTEILSRYSMKSEVESHWNLGALIVTER